MPWWWIAPHEKGRKGGLPEYEAESTVAKEQDLYAPLVEALVREESDSVAFDTASLRKRGKWQNPDVTQISVEIYPYLHRRRILLTTYEVKQWPNWDVNSVFEAASHARFAHAGFVALEWPEKSFSLSDPRLDQIVRECQRFGIGIATLERYYSQYRLNVRLEPVSKEPADADVEEWLTYALERRDEAKKKFLRLMNEPGKQI